MTEPKRSRFSIIEKIPQMTDAELDNLRANAELLLNTGTARHDTAAAEVLEAALAEIAARREKAKQAQAERRRTAKGSKPGT